MGKKVISETLYPDVSDDYFKQMSRQKEKQEPAVRKISLDKIKIRENVRYEYGKVEDMAESIKQKGLLQPITVIDVADGFYEIIFGHRRYKGYCHLNEQEPGKYTKIEAIVKDKADFNEDEIKEYQLIENIQRENLTPIETVNAFKHLREKGYTNKMIAGKIGKSEGYIKNIFMGIKSLKDNPELEEMVKSHAGVTLADIQEVRPLPFKHQIELIKKKLAGEITSREDLRSRVWQLRGELTASDQARYQKKKNVDIITRKENKIKIHSFTFDLSDHTDEEKNKLLSSLKALVSELEGVSV